MPKLMWKSVITSFLGNGSWSLGLEQVWPYSQTWLACLLSPVSYILGLYKLSLTLVASTWHLLGQQQKIALFLSGKLPVLVGESFSIKMLVCGWVGVKANTWGWAWRLKRTRWWGAIFSSGTKDLLVLRGIMSSLWKTRLRGSLL